MKLTLKTPKPRNPLVLPSRQRAAGAHRNGSERALPSRQRAAGAHRNGSERARAHRALRKELDDTLRPHT